MMGKIYVGMNIQIKFDLRSSRHHLEHLKQGGDCKADAKKDHKDAKKNGAIEKMSSCLLKMVESWTTYYFKLVEREFDPK